EPKQKLWTKIIKAKIDNQSKIMHYYTKNEDKYNQLQSYKKDVSLGDISNREGHAAKVYFNTIFGNGFHRGMDCIENAMLNYGYAIMRAYIARSILSYGYNPGFSIFHKSEYNDFGLADDIIEIFRPLVDAYVLEFILEEEIVEFLTQEIRAYLINILSERIYYKKKFQKVSTIISKVTLNCLNILDPDNEKELDFENFEILTSEGIQK